MPMRSVILLTRATALSLALFFAGGALISLTGENSAQAQENKERHPHIRAAIRELREAKKELEKADHDFGGHRKEAIEAINVAIKQLEKALKFDKN
jgi:hypothetical protein